MSDIARAGGACAICGKNPAAGYASMWSPSQGETWYCHGDDDSSPTCYEQAPMVVTEPRQQGYHGRLWDSPMTDELPKIDMTGATCVLCEETIGEHDDAIRQLQDYHLACFLRSILGDVYHQLEECPCFGGDKHDDEGTYREQSERALVAMIAAGRGRWVR